MERMKSVKAATLAAFVVGFSFAISNPAIAQEQVEWTMQSAFGSKLSILGEAVQRFQQNVQSMSAGTLRIEVYEPNALVPTLEGFEAVGKGSIDAMWGASAYHVGKIPALSWFTAVPFGPRAGEYLAWLRYGGGDDIYDEIYTAHGLKGLHCLIIAPEASGWFRKEIRSVEDLHGLKVRYGGLGEKVMAKMGASTQLLAPSDIYSALDRGVIDAAEFSMPSIDLAFGFHQVAEHYYFPGWHQQASIGELLINLEQWEMLSEQHKTIIEVACGDSLNWSFVRSEALQFQAMEKLQEEGVIFHRWPDNMLKLFEMKWQEVVTEESAKDPIFKKIYDSFRAFRMQYAIWRTHGYMD